jgi:hypothetical protein
MKYSKYFGAKRCRFIKSESNLAPRGAGHFKSEIIRCDNWGGGSLKILGFGFFTAPKEVRYNFRNLQFLHLIDLLSYSYFIEFKEHFHSCHYYPRH